jgi:hypothetical protein
MAYLRTIHHVNFFVDDILSIRCPCCGNRHMKQDEKEKDIWTCEDGHKLMVLMYQSSLGTLNIRFQQVN